MVHSVKEIIVSPLGLASVAVLLWMALVYLDVIENLLAKVSPFGPEKAELEWRSHFAMHAAFYGAVVAHFLAGDTFIAKVVSVTWFVMLNGYSILLHKNIAKEEHLESKVQKAEMLEDLAEALKKTKEGT